MGGRLVESCIAHNKALLVVGLPSLSIHGLRRPVDLLRMWHSKLEAWILDQAGVQFACSEVNIEIFPSVDGYGLY